MDEHEDMRELKRMLDDYTLSWDYASRDYDYRMLYNLVRQFIDSRIGEFAICPNSTPQPK